jgi:hypothetical protein
MPELAAYIVLSTHALQFQKMVAFPTSTGFLRQLQLCDLV